MFSATARTRFRWPGRAGCVVHRELSLRVCPVASSQFPICEPFAGGLEAYTHALTRKLLDHGHEVTLFAASGSDPALGAQCLLPERFGSSDSARLDVSARPEEWMQQHHAYLGLMLRLAGTCEFDIIHNNSLHHLPVALSSMLDRPLLTTLHTPPTPWLESAILYASSNVRFSAVSKATAAAWKHAVSAEVIFNGVDTERWQPGPGGNDCVWTGRFVEEKAPHLAIDAARKAGMRISLAGPVMDPQYFNTEIIPRLGSDAVYCGHLSQQGLQELIGHSAVAIVSPQWDEPYGLTAAEAIACGTPVASFARGGLNEIITPSSGVLAPPGSLDELADAILRAAELDRAAVRARAEEALSLDRMVLEYENLYGRAVYGADWNPPKRETA